MKRTFFLTAVVVAAFSPPASAQFFFLGPGSTPQGDYLRGVGVAAFGMGVYNLDTAMATSINADTAMRVNEYIYAALMNENRMNAEHRAAQFQRVKEQYQRIRDRISKSPEAHDVDTGNALNAVLDQLNSPLISPSALDYESIPLSEEDVKKIPFKLAEKGVRGFSIRRLTAKGSANWPIAFQDRQFDRDRERYEAALDNALDQQYRGAMQQSAIEELKAAVEILQSRLDTIIGPSSDRQYIEARNRLKEMLDTIEMLKAHKVELALGDLDHYSGKTVKHLLTFMRNHNLQFSRASNAEEKELFPALYAKLKQQYEKVSVGIGVKDEEPPKN